MLTRLLVLGLLAPSAAYAFCGTYVGSPDAELLSGASQVVLAREGTRTTLTLANDIEGNVKDFALVLPVPEVLDQGDVRVLDRGVLDRVAGYAGTRLVRYTCDDFLYEDDYDGRGCGCAYLAGGGYDSDADYADFDTGEPLDVTVEATFAAGEYDIVVLSSEDSADLLTWLNREGYAVTAEAEAMLGDYIRAGSKFLAAKVRLADVPVGGGPEGRPYLSPLQIAYTSDVFSLPIRLGTLNSPGSQDVVVYTLTPEQEGETSIANYPEVELPNDCMYDAARHGALDDYLDAEMSAVVGAQDGAAWVRTYSWSSSSCDPCPEGGALDPADALALGYRSGTPHLTRLWARYTPDAATQDLMLYTAGGWSSTFQLRYIAYDKTLESRYLICGETQTPADAGTCPSDARARQATLSLPLVFTVGLGSGLVGWSLRRRGARRHRALRSGQRP